MTEKQRFLQTQPTSGNRSKHYFGIQRQFAPVWFCNTSHSFTNGTAHPILSIFRGDMERQQLELKRQFIDAMLAKGSSKNEALTAWLGEVETATKLATDAFNRLSDHSFVVAWTDANVSAAEMAGRKALDHLKNALTLAQKSNPKQLDMLITSTRVYLRRYKEPEPDGRIHIKIGKTANSEARAGSYKNHSGGKLILVWEKCATESLNEDALRDALDTESGPLVTRTTRDWFFTPQALFELIDTPEKATQFIAKSQCCSRC